MTVSPVLGSVSELATILRIDIAPDDQYAVMMLAQASQAVRDAAGQPKWIRRSLIDDVLPDSYLDAPQTAIDVTLWVASRAFTDPRNRSRRTSGPISESFFENGVYGLDLTEGEKGRLSPFTDDGGSGLWVQRIGAGVRARPVILADSRAGSDPILYADPEWAWAFTPRSV